MSHNTIPDMPLSIRINRFDRYERYTYHTVSGRTTNSAYVLRFACREQAEQAYRMLHASETDETVDNIIADLDWYDGRYHTR